jgi:hypothetical protein
MTYKIDNKKRITLPNSTPGEVYDVEYVGAGHYRLTRMRRESPPHEENHRDAETQSEEETIET